MVALEIELTALWQQQYLICFIDWVWLGRVSTPWLALWSKLKEKKMKIQVGFKDPDAIYDIIKAKYPMPDDEQDITPRMEAAQEEFSEQFFQYDDYGMFEIDTETMTARLVPRSEWK